LELLSPTADITPPSAAPEGHNLNAALLHGEAGIELAIQQSVTTVQQGLQGYHPVSHQPVLMPATWPASETLTYTLHTLAEQIWASLATQAPPLGSLADPSKKELSAEVAVDFEVYQAALKGLAAIKTTWLNHTALCKPLALASFGSVLNNTLAGTGATWFGLQLQLVTISVYLGYIYSVTTFTTWPLSWVWAAEILYWLVTILLVIWYLRSERWHRVHF
jgi:hypothetical protein